MKPIKVKIQCEACGAKVDVTVTPGCPAQTYGPPERCYPAEPDEIDPDTCPKCDAAFDEDTVIQLAADKFDNDREAAAEARAKRLMEEE